MPKGYSFGTGDCGCECDFYEFETQGVFIEIVEERMGGIITKSINRQATKEEIIQAFIDYSRGKCKHSLIHDEKGWMYDIRSCLLCGEGLGVI
jgi:hypothetical protein